MGILWNIGELIMTCIDVVYLLSLPIFQMGCREWVKGKHIIFYGLLSAVVITLYNILTTNSISILFVSLTILFIYSIFFIKGRWLSKLFWVGFPLALLYGFDLATFSLLTKMYSHISIEVFYSPNIYRLQMIFCAKSVQILFMIFLLHTRLHLENFSYIVLLPVTLASFVSIFFLSYGDLHGFTDLEESISQSMLLQFALAFLFINLCYLILIAWINKRHEKLLHQQKKLSEQQLENQQAKLQQLLNQKLQLQQIELKLKSHEELAAAHEKLKKFQDDVKENLQSLWMLAKLHKIPQFEMYLTQISQINQQFNTLYQTGDDILDTVLSSKEAIANLHHITLRAKIGLPPPNEIISSIDLGTILINLLDNAIDALQNLIPADGLERTIELAMDIEDNFYKIKIKNPSNGQEQRSQDELTSLSSFKSTGLGLKIVTGLVDKYHGTLQIIHKDFVFTVLIQIPFKQNIPLKEDCHVEKDFPISDLLYDR